MVVEQRDTAFLLRRDAVLRAAHCERANQKYHWLDDAHGCDA
jgi:hypothetical protein